MNPNYYQSAQAIHGVPYHKHEDSDTGPGGSITIPDVEGLESALANKVDKDGDKILTDINFTVEKDNKLTGIATGATKNDSDVNLRDRSTHTGVQSINTITGLQGLLDNKVTKVSGKDLSSNDFTTANLNKLNSLSNFDDTAINTALSNKVDKVPGKGLSETDFTSLEKIKLSGLTNYNDTALVASIANKVDKVPGMGLSAESFTSEEKTKLQDMEGSHFRGRYPTVAALKAEVVGKSGDFAYVESPTDVTTIVEYIYDAVAIDWTVAVGTSTAETPATVKTKYESNPDTNAFTDANKTKLAGIAEQATKNDTDANLKNRANHTGTQAISTVTGLQNALDIKEPANSNIQQHILSKGNPHSVTKVQVGLGNVDNTSDLAKPISILTAAALADKEPANANIQSHIVSTTNPHNVTKTQVGLSNVDNTTDLLKPISTLTQTALDTKLDKVSDRTTTYTLYAKTPMGTQMNVSLAEIPGGTAERILGYTAGNDAIITRTFNKTGMSDSVDYVPSSKAVRDYVNTQIETVSQFYELATSTMSINSKTTVVELAARTAAGTIRLPVGNLYDGKKITIINRSNRDGMWSFGIPIQTPSGAIISRLQDETTTEVTYMGGQWLITNVSYRDSVFVRTDMTSMLLYSSGTYIYKDSGGPNPLTVSLYTEPGTNNLDKKYVLKNATPKIMNVKSHPAATNINDTTNTLVSTYVVPIGKTTTIVGTLDGWEVLY